MFLHNKTNKPPAYYQYCYTKPEEKHWLEYLIFVAAIVAAIATAYAACYTRLQWITAADQEKRSLRAYLVVTGFGIYCPDCGDRAAVPPDIIISKNATNTVIENNGQTPAYNVKHAITFYSQPGSSFAIPADFDFHDARIVPEAPYYGLAVFDIGKDKSRPVLSPLNANGLDRIKDAIEKKTTLFLYGHIDYCDAFREPHTTEFCIIYIPHGGGGQGMCNRHNGEVPGKHKC